MVEAMPLRVLPIGLREQRESSTLLRKYSDQDLTLTDAAGLYLMAARWLPPKINLSTPQPQVLCALTLVCSFGDIHPSDLGYQVIADVLWDASGYTRFEPRRH